MQSSAQTVSEYLAEQPTERKVGLEKLLKVIRENIKPGFDETMRWGMISFEVPLELSGPTYNSQPLSYIGLASQKHHYSVYLMGLYADPKVSEEFKARWAKAGLKLDMGKGCVRFSSLDKADLAAIGWAASLQTPAQMVEISNSRVTRK